MFRLLVGVLGISRLTGSEGGIGVGGGRLDMRSWLVVGDSNAVLAFGVWRFLAV